MTKIFAHRGYSGKYFENSREAFEACLDLDIYGIEMDVQLTKDGVPVVIHDEYLNRLLGIKKFVKDLSLDELKSHKYENGDEVLTLDEYLDIFKDSKLVTNAELKTGVFNYDGIERKVYDAFKEKNMLDRLIISSFNHYSLLRFKEIDKTVKTGALTGSTLINPAKYLYEYGIDYYHPVFTSVNKTMLKELKDLKKETNTWTINFKEVYDTALKLGVEGVITNYPKLDFEDFVY